MNQYNNYLSNHLGKIHRGNKKDFLLMEKYFAKNYLKYLPKDQKAKIVDLGCGMGHFLYFLKRNGYENYFGVDVSRECVDFCYKKKLAPKNRLLCDDVVSFFQKGKDNFDVVMMNDIVEHIPKDKIAPLLGLIKKSLSNNGRLIIKTINCANPITGPSSRYLDFTHTTGFTEESLSQVLNMAGFKKSTFILKVFGFLIPLLIF